MTVLDTDLYSVQDRGTQYVHPGVDFVGHVFLRFLHKPLDSTIFWVIHHHNIFGRLFNFCDLRKKIYGEASRGLSTDLTTFKMLHNNYRDHKKKTKKKNKKEVHDK